MKAAPDPMKMLKPLSFRGLRPLDPYQDQSWTRWESKATPKLNENAKTSQFPGVRPLDPLLGPVLDPLKA